MAWTVHVAGYERDKARKMGASAFVSCRTCATLHGPAVRNSAWAFFDAYPTQFLKDCRVRMTFELRGSVSETAPLCALLQLGPDEYCRLTETVKGR